MVLLLLIYCLMYFTFFVGVLCFFFTLLCITLCIFELCNHLEEEEKAGCVAIIVLQMCCCNSRFVTLPHGAVCWSAVCDCCIS